MNMQIEPIDVSFAYTLVCLANVICNCAFELEESLTVHAGHVTL